MKDISRWCARPRPSAIWSRPRSSLIRFSSAPVKTWPNIRATFDRDRELFQQEGVDFIFAPSVEEMYPAGAVTYVTVEGLSDKLCGRSRPGHFRGVTTVVAKLFNIVEPDRAFFGQKDAAQSTIIRRMVRDLNIPVQVVVCPIVREPDGLAMSSRNAYLDPQQRKSARVLYRSLMAVQERFDQGERKVQALIEAGKQAFAQEPSVRLDYFEIVDPETLDPVDDLSRARWWRWQHSWARRA